MSNQCCQPCGFPGNWGLFLLSLWFYFQTYWVACFLRVAHFTKVINLSCFNSLQKKFWACLCVILIIFCLFIRVGLAIYSFVANLLIGLFFVLFIFPIMRVFGFFPIILSILACFFQIYLLIFAK